MDRANKPKTLPKLSSTPGLPPQPTVTFTDDNSRLRADLPTGESVEVLLYGATVISWKDATGDEKLWLSEAAKLDGSKAVRGGIPLVFPVFGTAPDHPQTKDLPQHGFARTSRWEFLGKSTSESMVGVKLDFGLSSAAPGLDPKAAALWPFKFNLIYSVTLNPESLTTSIVATNDDPAAPFDCQVLMHTYLRVKSCVYTPTEKRGHLCSMSGLLWVARYARTNFNQRGWVKTHGNEKVAALLGFLPPKTDLKICCAWSRGPWARGRRWRAGMHLRGPRRLRWCVDWDEDEDED
ncbi:hypothetical protein CHGG_01773 [Chaetomium globosum CBS 148.51]|uniref:Glucose-6-phosphate 1-epimerase n=1 Tax=Chaetomium globosum (strain ATCC 6205 / CBS 148.51 / DSM 1962 / NBRC 6347 / NRRL 1970) TaxID=306901 RepID=Q2HDD1_CHAGB|nr:uncharacterized protein CHGG_01773 [Chaetomium globosum CBS 148.51]EAQ93538.1 hypothetical protein CHGG_01773 [Chaetomium globosum CBS 148.51]